MNTTTTDAKVWDACGRCGGEGSVSWGANLTGRVHNITTGQTREVPKVCFQCNGVGGKWVTQATLDRRAKDRARREAKRIAEAEAKVAARAAEVEANRTEFTAQYGDVVEILPTLPGSFGESLREQFQNTGKLSEGQVEAARRISTEQANQPEETPVVEGRITITGKVLTTKVQDTEWGTQYKMLVVDDRGFKVWGSIPRDLDAEKGDRVEFTATVEQSDKDETFGFYKRPTKSRVL